MEINTWTGIYYWVIKSEYYSNYPQCPQCNEPVTPGQYNDFTKCATYTCIYCGALFNSCINIEKECKLVKNLENKAEKFQRFRMPWAADLNYIEKEYVRFVNSNLTGKYLVTWPWKHDGFIAILANEYIKHNPEKKLVVVMDRDYEFPDLKTIYENMFMVDNKSNICPINQEEIKKSIKKVVNNNIFEKMPESDYRIKKAGSGLIDSGSCSLTAQKCKNQLIKSLREDYGIQCDILTANRKRDTNNYNNIRMEFDCSHDIKINIFQHTHNYKKRYDPSWISNLVMNFKYIRKPENTGITFLYYDDSIIDRINEIRPDLIIVQKMENLMLYYQNFIWATPENTNYLMFSIDPLERYKYNQIFLEKYGVKMHTWDNKYVLGKIRDVVKNFHSLLSEDMNDIELDERKYVYEFINISELNILEQAIDIIKRTNLDANLSGRMMDFIGEMKKTILDIRGDYTKQCVFKRTFNGGMTYDMLLTNMYNTDKVDDIKKIFVDVYGEYFDNNPLREQIIIKIRELLKINNSNIYVILSLYDLKGAQNIFKKHFNDNCMKRIHICNIRGIKNIRTINNYIISTLLSVELPRPESIEKLYFMGDSIFIDKAKFNAKFKLDSMKNYPISIPENENDNVSQLLKQLLGDVVLPEKETIERVIKELEWETSIEISDNDRNNDSNPQNYTRHMLTAGDVCIKVANGNNECVYIPENIHILVKKGDLLTEEYIGSIDKFNARNLLQKNLIIDKHNTYTSFRSLFIKIMSNNKSKYTLVGTEVNGFQELYAYATSWVEIIKKAIALKISNENLNYDGSEDSIVNWMINLNLTAKNPEYIRRWWKPEDSVLTDNGEFIIYPEDHPASFDDIEKIFNGLIKLYPGITEKYDAIKCYKASLYIQSMRRNILINKENNTREYYNEYRQLINEIWNNSRIFQIETVNKIHISQNTLPMTVNTCE